MQNNKSASLASKARLKAGLKETSFQACSVYSGGASHSRHLEPGYALFGNVVFWKFFGHHYAFALVLCSGLCLNTPDTDPNTHRTQVGHRSKTHINPRKKQINTRKHRLKKIPPNSNFPSAHPYPASSAPLAKNQRKFPRQPKEREECSTA